MISKAARLEGLLAPVPDALVGMDPSGVIRFVNHQSELLFGYEHADLVGLRVETLVPERLWQAYLDHRDDYFVDSRSRSLGLDLELSGRHSDGSKFPVIVNLSGIDTGDLLLDFTAVNEPGSTTEIGHGERVGAREYPSDLGEYGLAKVVVQPDRRASTRCEFLIVSRPSPRPSTIPTSCRARVWLRRWLWRSGRAWRTSSHQR